MALRDDSAIGIPGFASSSENRGKISSVFRVFIRYPVAPLFVLAVLLFTGIAAPWLEPKDPIKQNLRARNAPPSWHDPAWYADNPNLTESFFLGADHVGRDVLSRLIQGTRVSLIVVAVSMATGLVVGTALGLIGGWFGGLTDELIMRMVDIWAAVPFLLVALVVAVVLGSSLAIMMALLALLAWSGFVRNVRAEVLSLKERDYVKLAQVAGASTPRVLIKHVFPGITNTMVVIATLNVGGLILAEATLSFLGAGIPGPKATWGLMINEGRLYLSQAWWITVFPGTAIFLVVMSLNFLGDWLRDYLDPRLRQL